MKLAICGIGNKLRGDDGVGPLVINELKKEISSKNILLLDCDGMPENFVEKVANFKPKKVVIIDAVDLKKKPGTVSIVNPSAIKGNLISTHKLPLGMFIEQIKKRIKCSILFIGVQPKQIGFNKKMSKECTKSIKTVKKVIKLLQ